MAFLMPLLGLGLMFAMQASKTKSPSLPNLPGPTDAEVLASDMRLRRRLGAEQGNRSTLVSGGRSNATARLTMPSLVGI